MVPSMRNTLYYATQLDQYLRQCQHLGDYEPILYIKGVCIIITGSSHCANMATSLLSLPVLYT